jgi:hypothetical protein
MRSRRAGWSVATLCRCVSPGMVLSVGHGFRSSSWLKAGRKVGCGKMGRAGDQAVWSSRPGIWIDVGVPPTILEGGVRPRTLRQTHRGPVGNIKQPKAESRCGNSPRESLIRSLEPMACAQGGRDGVLPLCAGVFHLVWSFRSVTGFVLVHG